MEEPSITNIYKEVCKMQGLLCGAKFGLRADYRKYLSIRMDHLAGQIALICV
jgi:hypothetical protein